MGRALLTTYAIGGAAWLWNETSPLGWWTLKPRTKEEKQMAHLYERREFPYPGDEEAVREFIAKGGSFGTTIGPKGIMDKTGNNPQTRRQEEKFEREAQKLWLRMRNEVIEELQDQGYEIE
ncbi:hypothetical protein KI387_015459 [Taxus chinensis]|uniref:Uncharacterized protein n=1 Tax=Taxus chinensis TaxID=29808 RepID=A0AA38GG55_TAXCH|nr:hypothetical protein KI387_015459 [Taxus chinensis]